MTENIVAACMYVWQLSFIHATETYTHQKCTWWCVVYIEKKFKIEYLLIIYRAIMFYLNCGNVPSDFYSNQAEFTYKGIFYPHIGPTHL